MVGISNIVLNFSSIELGNFVLVSCLLLGRGFIAVGLGLSLSSTRNPSLGWFDGKFTRECVLDLVFSINLGWRGIVLDSGLLLYVLGGSVAGGSTILAIFWFELDVNVGCGVVGLVG